MLAASTVKMSGSEKKKKHKRTRTQATKVLVKPYDNFPIKGNV